MCEPRSTRRTSDSSYRINPKKSFASPEIYRSASMVPSLPIRPSSRSTPDLSKPTVRRAISDTNFSTTNKLNQAAMLSGFPTLKPLPIHSSHIVDECYSRSSSPDQSLGGFPHSAEYPSFHSSRDWTPQTPEPFVYDESLAMKDPLNHYATSWHWSGNEMVPFELNFDEVAGSIPGSIWSTPEPEPTESTDYLNVWPYPSFSLSPQQIPTNTVPHTHETPLLSIRDCSMDDYSSLDPIQDAWASCQSIVSQNSITDMITSSPYIYNTESVPDATSIWEDVFIPDTSSYYKLTYYGEHNNRGTLNTKLDKGCTYSLRSRAWRSSFIPDANCFKIAEPRASPRTKKDNPMYSKC